MDCERIGNGEVDSLGYPASDGSMYARSGPCANTWLIIDHLLVAVVHLLREGMRNGDGQVASYIPKRHKV